MTQTNWSRFFFIFLLSFTFLKCLEALLLPYPHGDALYYHLVGPKIWYYFSWSEMWKDVEVFINGGIFDLIFILPFYFTHSLLKVQLVGQFFHLFFSLILGAFLTFKNLKNPLIKCLGALAILTIARESAFFLYAKNDGVVALNALLLAIVLFKYRANSHWSYKFQFLLAFLFALGPHIKMNAVIYNIPLFLAFLFYRYKKPNFLRELCFITVTIILLVIPLFIRNYIYTESPFFPALLSKFPGNLSGPTLHHYNVHYGNPTTLPKLFMHLKDFFLGKVMFLIFPWVMLVNYRKKIPGNFFALMSVATFLLYVLYNGSFVHARYFFACYFLLAYFLFFSFDQWIERKIFPQLRPIPFAILLFSLIMMDSKLDKTIRHIARGIDNFSHLNETTIVRQEIPLTTFIDHLSPPTSMGKIDYILSDELSDSYYLPLHVRLHTAVQTARASFLLECKNPVEDIKKFANYRYVLLALDNNNACYTWLKTHTQYLTSSGHYKLYQIL